MREALLIAWDAAADPALHSVLTGRARPGAQLTVSKEIGVDSSPVTLPGVGTVVVPSRVELSSTLTVPAGGRFEWHVQPSLRPSQYHSLHLLELDGVLHRPLRAGRAQPAGDGRTRAERGAGPAPLPGRAATGGLGFGAGGRDRTEIGMSGTADPRPGTGGAEALRPPRDVVLAMRLMYAGAALTALLGLLRLIDPDAYDDALDTSSGTTARGSYVAYLFIVAVIWLLVARYCARGSRWARRAATFFAVLYVAAVAVTLAGAARFDAYNIVSLLVAVVAVAVIWLLYRPESRRWFLRPGPPTS